jgi:hypothetical protein
VAINQIGNCRTQPTAQEECGRALDTQHRAMTNRHAAEMAHVMAGVASEYGGERLERIAELDRVCVVLFFVWFFFFFELLSFVKNINNNKVAKYF